MPTIKKIPRMIFPILLVPVVFAGVLGITASFRNSSTATSKPSVTATSKPSVTATGKPSVTATAASAELETLLNKGKGHTDEG